MALSADITGTPIWVRLLKIIKLKYEVLTNFALGIPRKSEENEKEL